MSDKKGAKVLNIHQVIVILIIFIRDFSTEKQKCIILYNYGLIITVRIGLKSLHLSLCFDDH